jgi:haloalkane dehalogenase
MNTAAFRDSRCPRAIRLCHVPLLGRLAIQGLNVFARAALHSAVEHHERMTPAVRAGLLAPYDSWRNRVAIDRFVNDIPLRPSHPSYATLEKIEAGLTQFRASPVCLIWGMRDWCFGPQFLERFREFFPAAEVHRLADAGHYVVEDAHERIVPLVSDFLARHPLPSQPPVQEP